MAICGSGILLIHLMECDEILFMISSQFQDDKMIVLGYYNCSFSTQQLASSLDGVDSSQGFRLKFRMHC
jgi:hypothetical protein